MDKLTPLQLFQYCQKHDIQIERIEDSLITLTKRFSAGDVQG